MPASTEPVTNSSQYSLQSILWMTTAIALLLMHARNAGARALDLLPAYAAMWSCCVVLLAIFVRDRRALFFWSALIVVEAFLAVSAVKLLNINLAYGWGAVAAVGGTLASITSGKRFVGLAVINSGLSLAAMAGTMWVLKEPLGIESALDLAGAAGVGFSLTFFVYFLKWFTQQTRQPWPVVAAWLTTFVLLGNLCVRLSGY